MPENNRLDTIEKQVRLGVNLIATPVLMIVVTFFLHRMVNQVDLMNDNINRHIQLIRINEVRIDGLDARTRSLEVWRDNNAYKKEKTE